MEASCVVHRRGNRQAGSVENEPELSGDGSVSYHPSLLLGLLVYGYATGVFSSRKLKRATYDFGPIDPEGADEELSLSSDRLSG